MQLLPFEPLRQPLEKPNLPVVAGAAAATVIFRDTAHGFLAWALATF